MYTFYWLKFIHNRSNCVYFLPAQILFLFCFSNRSSNTFWWQTQSINFHSQLSTDGFRTTQSDSSCNMCFTKRFTYFGHQFEQYPIRRCCELGKTKPLVKTKFQYCHIEERTTQAHVSPTRFE